MAPRCEASVAPVAELARLGRLADVAVGPGSSSTGWAPDPDDPDGFRFVGPKGLTPYTAGEVLVGPVTPRPVSAQSDGETGDSLAASIAVRLKRIRPSAPARPVASTTAISPTSARPEAVSAIAHERPAEFWQYVGLGVVAIALYTLARLLTAGDPASTSVAFSSLSDAPNSPALIRSIIGALAAGTALYGRQIAQVGKGWASGPGVDPTPHRPDECEA